MLRIQRIDPLNDILDKRFVTFVGAGGKTSLIEYLAAGAVKQGKRVALTTTTKIFVKAPYILTEKGLYDRPGMPPYLRIGRSLENGKLTAITFDEIDILGKLFDLVLIEADGSKRLPLKYPAEYEPVIPPCSESIYVIAGLDSLSGTVREKVFRWELCCGRTDIKADEAVSPDLFLRFFSRDILLKGVEERPCTIVLNKFDALASRGEALKLAGALLNATPAREVITSCMPFGIFYKTQLV
ncbi:MAG TPA: selenium cofactor biosynthesis protein YqeC [Syntrophorhabdaceae bacterium]|nr:selenium cofactor biosynthesis protein YqeC [Syntrophorhabdaceae bacterium]HNT67753.1 selenium cofactor biosynthesis protein YqeC [Syntrophorhabdaceae bacterium]